MNWKWMLVVAAACLFLAGTSTAQTPEPPEPTDPPENGGEATVEKKFSPGEQRRMKRIADGRGATLEEVQNLRSQGLGYGEIEHALAISRAAEVPIEEVMRLRNEEKMGWGRIAKEYDLKLGDLKRRGKKAAAKEPPDAVEPPEGEKRMREPKERLRDAIRDEPRRAVRKGVSKEHKRALRRPRHSAPAMRRRGFKGRGGPRR